MVFPLWRPYKWCQKNIENFVVNSLLSILWSIIEAGFATNEINETPDIEFMVIFVNVAFNWQTFMTFLHLSPYLLVACNLLIFPIILVNHVFWCRPARVDNNKLGYRSFRCCCWIQLPSQQISNHRHNLQKLASPSSYVTRPDKTTCSVG